MGSREWTLDEAGVSMVRQIAKSVRRTLGVKEGGGRP